MKRTLTTGLLAAVLMVTFAVPSSATVHEITGMFCAGEHGNHTPPGISDPSRNNLARPLFANGFVASVEPYEGAFGPGVLITFDFDHPASKLAPHPTVDVFFFGDGVYVTAFVLDGAFMNCKAFRS